ncbi:GDP-mannose 4,6-dehydratase [Roseimarinus sediminis]|uniref:GDP-mannose 4,6-dehydratase n=1 Tax=Roseimarinus sediminis TaxID=1610899 RepID=UPI003D217C9A
MKQKKILLTGCAGFIGSHLSEKLLGMNYQLTGIDNFDPFYPASIKLANMASFKDHPNFRFIEADLADAEKLKQLFPEGIDLVVHLAGKAGVRPSIEDPAGYIRANITATQNVLEMMKLHGVSRMAFASSSSVYGNTKTTPFSEAMDVSNPISPYAATKKACELINYTAHYLHHFSIVNMRFFTVFGPRQRPDLAIHKFTRLIRSGAPVTMFGDGSTARDYTYIDDTIQGILGAIDYLFANEDVYETVNLGNNQPVLLRDMIASIYKATGERPNIEHLPMQPGDVEITYADITRAKQLFDYEPQHDFDEGIKAFVSWYDAGNEKPTNL